MPVTVETYPTAAEAARALAHDRTARFLAGGTLVMRAVNEGDPALRRIVRTTDPSLTEIRPAGDTITLGAAVTMTAILAHRDLAVLAPVARVVGGPQIRTMATVGGNLFAPHPYGDLATALLALGARAHTAEGVRPLDDLLRDRGRAPFVTAIEIPRPRDPRAFAFLKVSRVKPKGVAVLSVAAHLPREAGRIRGPRVAWGGMAATPIRAAAVERALDGQALDRATIARAAQAAPEGLDPPTDALASGWYRREVAAVHLRRLLEGMAR
jgi:CO/xanthine dehydrogenase FAD-binding subunit